MMCATEPFPFVPATWIVKKFRWGFPMCRQNAEMRSNPGLYPVAPWVSKAGSDWKRNSRVWL